jgi:hypothetical protein
MQFDIRTNLHGLQQNFKHRRLFGFFASFFTFQRVAASVTPSARGDIDRARVYTTFLARNLQPYVL